MRKLIMGLFLTCMGLMNTYHACAQSTVIQLRSNGLYDLAASPNIGIELQSQSGWAWQLDYIGAWWNSHRGGNVFANYGFQTEIRRYLGRNYYAAPFLGQHIGLYGQLATYDFKFGEKGFLSRNLDDSFGMGLSYGYCQRINKALSVDFTIGCGFFTTMYDRYKYIDQTDVFRKIKRERKCFVGPTKLEVSLVWNLSHANRPSYF